VNHKQTYHQEVHGGYLWSPKRNRNGAQNRTYDNMTLVQPGEVVFSYASGAIQAIGRARGTARSSKQPSEFGRAGKSWSKHDGWKVPVQFTQLVTPFRPKLHMRELRQWLPAKHSPIRANGKGNQGVYLAKIPAELARVLQRLMHDPPLAAPTRERENDTQREREELTKVNQIKRNTHLTQTEKQRLVAARIGQGLFRQNVEAVETSCRVTGITDRRFLRASHIRPWRHSNNRQRLDGNNGLLLAPHIDHLFDGGYISFTDEGDVIVAKVCPREIHVALGLRTPLNVGAFSPAQQTYLRYHRRRVFGGGARARRTTRSKRSGRKRQ
jgi:hypothetical protein